MTGLDVLVRELHNASSVSDKVGIRHAYRPAEPISAGIPLGDDCAAIPDGDGYLLLAAEGILDEFVADDPWFAGYSALMVNVSDVAAMGGRTIAAVDVLCTPSHEAISEVWDGMRDASERYGVPIVGGHTTLARGDRGVRLSVAILGRANVLLTSFDAQPGDRLLMAVDLNGAYRGERPFWNASTSTEPARLQRITDILPRLAELGLCGAAKDISNGGLIGTIVMLLECSRVGACLDIDALPKPKGVDSLKWLLSFPSFGYVLAVRPKDEEAVMAYFQGEDIACAAVGEVDATNGLELRFQGEAATFWRADQPHEASLA